jgi:isoleucyl-tRNA synthetase
VFPALTFCVWRKNARGRGTRSDAQPPATKKNQQTNKNQNRHVKEADKEIVQAVKRLGRLVDVSTLTHSYPFCWRSDTPLIYRAVPSWFVAVEKIKEQLLSCNAETYWVPSYVKDKRFHAWLEGAHDWAVSRSRFWGTPIPVWCSEDGEEVVVIGSVEELEKRVGGAAAGKKIEDLHRHFVDALEIPSSRGPDYPPLKRVEDVFDCWFESGSMPYGQLHYPFENKERFEKNFPADFVAEGLDQTRGWFYTLMVLSTALFGKPAFRNLVCNGLVLAADGKKMSKRLKNYPVRKRSFFFFRGRRRRNEKKKKRALGREAAPPFS